MLIYNSDDLICRCDDNETLGFPTRSTLKESADIYIGNIYRAPPKPPKPPKMISKPFQNNGEMMPRPSHNGPEGSGTAGATMVYVAIFGAYARKLVFEKT